MKVWLPLILVSGVLVLLRLTQAVSLNYTLPVAGFGPWFDGGRGSASDPSSVSFLRTTELHLVRAGPLQSHVPDCASTAGNISPPGQENNGPPARTDGAWRVAGHAGNSNQGHRTLSPQNYWLNRPNFKNRGFATAFS